MGPPTCQLLLHLRCDVEHQSDNRPGRQIRFIPKQYSPLPAPGHGQGVADRTGVGHEDPVWQFSVRPAVGCCRCTPAERRRLFKAGVVDDQHRARATELRRD